MYNRVNEEIGHISSQWRDQVKCVYVLVYGLLELDQACIDTIGTMETVLVVRKSCQ